MTGFPDGKCDCFNDMGICCYGYFCPYCLSLQNVGLVDGTGCTIKHCCCPFGEFWVRQTIRRRKNLPEECCADCQDVGYCCPSCALCQDARALKIGFGTPLPGEGYRGFVNNTPQEPANPVVVVNNAAAPPPGYAAPPPGYAAPPPPGYAAPPPPPGYAEPPK